jgi:glyoxylase-like metal-dependent hydrolase (beta-lactamase superfamily II)
MADFHPVTEHISRLALDWRFGPLRFPVNVWLVRGQEGFVLIDAGPESTADQVVAAVARATSGRGVRLLLLTHAHPDHAGGLAALRTAWNPPIVCHRLEVPFVTGELYYRELPATTPSYWIGRYLIGPNDWELPVAKDLEGGQSVEGMAVIPLPGHTPGQVGYLHSLDRAMICGDAVISLGRQVGPPRRWTTADPQTASESIERLGQLDYRHLLPSHGEPILKRGRQAMLDFLGSGVETGEVLWS